MFSFFKKNKNEEFKLLSPADGKTVALNEVPDPVFAEKMMGDGIAVQVEGDYIKAPADGTISLIPSTKHAFGMVLDNGVELLVHVGLDTVSLNGEGFEIITPANTKVKAGTPVLKINRPFITDKGINLITPLIIINHSDYSLNQINTNIQATAGSTVLIEYTKK